MVEDLFSFLMPLCARSISYLKPHHVVLHIMFVFSTSHIYLYPDTRFDIIFLYEVVLYMISIHVCLYTLSAKNMEYFLFQRLFSFLWGM